MRRQQAPLNTTLYTADSASAAAAAAAAAWNMRAAVGVRQAGAGAGRGGMCSRRAKAPPRTARAQRTGGEFAACGDDGVVSPHDSADCDGAWGCGTGENWSGLATQQEVLGRYSKLAAIGDCGAFGDM